MAHTFTLPDLGEGLTEGEVARWLVREGETVAENDPIVEIQTDKATVEIGAPVDGVVLRIVAREGEVAPVGATLAVIGAVGELLLRPVETTPAAPPEPPTPPIAVVGPEPPVVVSLRAPTEPREGRRIPIRGIRRAIVEQVERTHREIPAVTFVEECDFTGVDRERLVALALRAAADSLGDYPELNARIDGDEIVQLDRYDLGVAVDTDAGLVVPVVRGCDALTVDEIDTEVRRLAEGARAGTLQPHEVRDSTFTVTSAGRLGGLFSTPLVNHPEVAILGLHRIGPRPVVLHGSVVVREIGNVSVTFDHRVVDGSRAGAFCLDVIRRLEGETPH